MEVMVTIMFVFRSVEKFARCFAKCEQSGQCFWIHSFVTEFRYTGPGDKELHHS